VAAVGVFFFNTNLLSLPSALQAFYATMNEKEGVAIVTFFSLLQKKKRKKATTVTFFAMLQGKEKKGDGSFVAVAFFAALQRNKKNEKGDCNFVAFPFFFAPSCVTKKKRNKATTLLPLPSSLGCAAT